MLHQLSDIEIGELLLVLGVRFVKFPQRHSTLVWEDVKQRLLNNKEKLAHLWVMEATGGEPDVVAQNADGSLVFMDCSAESPKQRRSICYDQQALDARKENKPADSAINMAKNMGIEILDEDQYRYLQTLGEFDLKTSSWIKTPNEIRQLGGALFGDKRYNTTFFYHNGAESYYAARGFRGSFTI
jgi:hypothetical protein